MNAIIQRGWQRARRRQGWISAVLAVPIALALSAVAWRVAGFNAFTVILLLTLLVGKALLVVSRRTASLPGGRKR